MVWCRSRPAAPHDQRGCQAGGLGRWRRRPRCGAVPGGTSPPSSGPAQPAAPSRAAERGSISAPSTPTLPCCGRQVQAEEGGGQGGSAPGASPALGPAWACGSPAKGGSRRPCPSGVCAPRCPSALLGDWCVPGWICSYTSVLWTHLTWSLLQPPV